MKILLGIVCLSLLLSGNAYSDENNNLRGIKKFNLIVDHAGECKDENYGKELITNVKHLINNSKIKLSETAKEFLKLSIHTSSDNNKKKLCVSMINLEIYSFGMVENSVGEQRFHTRVSYKKEALVWDAGFNHHNKHRDRIIRYYDQWIKELILDWSNAQRF
jgi:hypothetical protein